MNSPQGEETLPLSVPHPLLVIVNGLLSLPPIVPTLKLKLPGLTPHTGVDGPVPAQLTEQQVPPVLIVQLSLPQLLGVYVTVNVALWPAPKL